MSLINNEVKINPAEFIKALEDQEEKTLFLVLRLAKKAGVLGYQIDEIGRFFNIENIYNLL